MAPSQRLKFFAIGSNRCEEVRRGICSMPSSAKISCNLCSNSGYEGVGFSERALLIEDVIAPAARPCRVTSMEHWLSSQPEYICTSPALNPTPDSSSQSKPVQMKGKSTA